jgi:hypothetical protein
VSLHVQNVTVEKSYEVGVADLEDAVASVAVRVNMSTSSSHDGWDIVLADESSSCFEASSSTESVQDVVDAEDHISEDAMLCADLMRSESVNVNWLLWAHNTVVDFNALTEEELMEFFNIITSTEDALVVPEVLEVIAANPLLNVLMSISQVGLEASSSW